MRRTIKAGAVIAGLALVLTACSSDDGDSGDAGAEASGSLLIWADELRSEPIQALADEWGQENGVDVTVTRVDYEGMKASFIQQAPSGEGPDLLLGGNDFTGELSASGLISPVQLGANAENFEQVAVDAFTLDGQTYAVPVAIENIALFRNPELAPDAPASINEMAETGLALQEEGKTQYPIGVQVGDAGDAYHAYPFYSAAGAYFFEKDADGNYDPATMGVGSEESLVFAEAWGQLGESGAIKSTFVGDNIRDAFTSGEAPYFVTGPWNLPSIKESGVDYVVESVPGWEGVDAQAVPIVGSQGFFLNSASTNQTTAQAFLNATMDTEFMDALFEADPRPPAWKESATKAASDPDIKAFGEFGADGFPNLPIPEMGPVYEELGLAEKKILDGSDPTTTMEEAQANIESRIS